jgi:S1-C subfamily serine protease
VIREIASLISTGSYDKHPTIGAIGTDMTYEIAEAMHVNVTYGWLIIQVTDGGAAAEAKLQGGTQQATVAGQTITIGGDIIIAINGTRIKNLDDMSTFLEENTLPGETIEITIIRNDQTLTIPLKLGTRPALT